MIASTDINQKKVSVEVENYLALMNDEDQDLTYSDLEPSQV